MIVETDSFLYLDYYYVARILKSSSLNMILELDPSNAVERWLIFNTKERNKFAKDLLLKVRLHSLSHNSLKRLFFEPSLFYKTELGIEIFKEILCTKKNSFHHRSNATKMLYSYKEKHNKLVCGGYRENVQLKDNQYKYEVQSLL